MHEKNLITARKICKSFGPTRALIDVDIDIRRGEIRGLIGENGSGKSTFSSIAAGLQKADSGEMYLEGEKYDPKDMVDAQRHKVSMIVQEMGAIPGITVASNIFAGRLGEFSKFGVLNWKKINRAADAVLADIGAPDIRGEVMTSSLNFEDRKIVEIARAMSTNPDVLIIDETTTALAQKGRTIIYNLIRRMHEENKAVFFISHDLDELMEVCNTITVLRDGVIIDTLDRENMSVERMRKLMVGREINGEYYRADVSGSSGSEVLLKADHISVRPWFQNISLEVHAGEILGFGGLSGSGMHEVGRALFGIDKVLTGSVTLPQKGKEIMSPQSAVKNGMAYIPKDRDNESIVLTGSISNNILVPVWDKLKNKVGFIRPGEEESVVQEQIGKLGIKCRNGKQLVKELSGGNKQKVAFSKWLGNDCDIFIMDCPTRGIDIGVKTDMYRLMERLKKEGKGIILISEELPELLGMSDRVLLFKDGMISKEFKREEQLGEHDVIEYII
jgi:ribose transport system ATP-binding protein